MKTFLIAIMLLLQFSYASAEPKVLPYEAICDDTDKILNNLTKKFKEKPLIFGLASDQIGSTMSIWSNPKTKTWTIIATKGTLTCVIGDGTNILLLLGDLVI